jgi:Glycosyl transferase family 2
MNWLDAVIGASEIVSSNWPPPQELKPKKCASTAVPTIDVVIPTCGGEFVKGKGHLGLMMTLRSCEKALEGFDYKYFIVCNGTPSVGDSPAQLEPVEQCHLGVSPTDEVRRFDGNPTSGDSRDSLNMAIEYARSTGHLGRVFNIPKSFSPPAARKLGAAVGKGDLIFFFDDHCDVDPAYFKTAIKTFESVDADCVHGVVEFNRGDCSWELSKVFSFVLSSYHFNLDRLDRDFFGQPSSTPYSSTPYQIAGAPHSSFAIKRSVWEEIGGYWDGFLGWGGGDASYLSLKLNMLDKNIYLDPAMRHWHFFGNLRDYKTCRILQSESSGKALESIPFTGGRFLSFHNMLCVANIIGGKHWARKVADSLRRREEILPKQRYDSMLATAIAWSERHAQWFASKKRKRTLDEQLEKFKAENVAM